MRILVADACTAGFMRWAETRLTLIGYRVVYPRAYWRYDHFLARYARKIGGVVVTRDKTFPNPKILISRQKNEEAWTELCRGLRGILHGEMCIRSPRC